MKNLLVVRSVAITSFLLLALVSLPLTGQFANAAFTISYANVGANQVLSGTFEVVVTASDISQVANIKLYINDVFFKTENNSPYEFNINTANYPDGPRILKAVATDKLGNTNAATAIVNVVINNNGGGGGGNGPIVMDDTTSTTGQSVWSGRPVHAEYATAASVLVGKQIDSISLKLKKISSPPGIAEIGIINADLSMKKVFGTITVSTLTTSYAYRHFALSGECYTIQAGDRIGVKYPTGTSSNYIAIMRDTNSADPFDGTKTHHTTYTNKWNLYTSVDLTMTLKMIGSCSPPGPDETSPSVSVNHSPAVPFSSSTISFTASATDNAALSQIEIFVDGGSIGNCSVSGTSANCVKTSGPFAPSTTHSYYATVTDTSTNGATSSTGSLTISDLAPPSGTLPTAQQVYNTETFNVPDGVSHFILLIPNEAHEPNSEPDKFIASTNRHYLATNLQIAQNTAITMINDDGGHTHTTQAKRQDNGVTQWTTNAISESQHSTPPQSFTDLTQYDIVDTVEPSMAGTVAVRAATIDPSGQIVGCLYVPTSQLNTFKTLLTNNGFTTESEYSFTYETISANFSDNNTLIVYSTTQPLSTALSALSNIVQQTPYE